MRYDERSAYRLLNHAMSDQENPLEIARKALKFLAEQHRAPTPENFQLAYEQVTGGSGARTWPAVGVVSAGLDDALVDFCEQLQPLFEDLAGGEGGEFLPLLILLRQPPVPLEQVVHGLQRLAQQLPRAVTEQLEVRRALFDLLHLLVENIADLAGEDQWLRGQLDSVRSAMRPPFVLRAIDQARERLQEVVVKQRQARQGVDAVHAEMQQMLDAFIQRLATMSESSTGFHSSLEGVAARVERAVSLSELRPLLGEIVGTARQMATQSAEAGRELQGLQTQVQEAETRLQHLRNELDQASAQARHDPLTDALNRRGLDEALEREISRMRRQSGVLSLCLLDIDNFKKLNDRLGHRAGDAALQHLADVARACMRPTDSLARYGGEEFVILMPATPQAEAIDVIVRLQRELTRRIYLSGRERVLITFSAGLVQLAPGEAGDDAIQRADAAMYLAKRSGKNRVIAA